MNFAKLSKAAKDAIFAIENAKFDVFSSSTKNVVLAQLRFILDCSEKGLKPQEHLASGQTFTYGIIASRELASPEELSIKELLDAVSNELYPR